MARFLDPETLNCHAAAGRQQASMSRPHAQIDLRRPFYSAEDEEDEVYEDENDQSFGAAEPHVSRNLLHRHGERTGAGMVNEDEEVDSPDLKNALPYRAVNQQQTTDIYFTPCLMAGRPRGLRAVPLGAQEVSLVPNIWCPA